MTVLVVNTLNSGVSEYTQYPFTSGMRVGDKYFAVGPGGIAETDLALTDAGADIPASVTTGILDFGSQKQKRVSDVFLTTRATTATTVTFRYDELPLVTASMDAPLQPNLSQRRVKAALGMVGKMWQIGVANTRGGVLDIAAINIDAHESTRRL